MPIGDPTPSAPRRLRPAARVACALLAALSFAGSAATAANHCGSIQTYWSVEYVHFLADPTAGWCQVFTELYQYLNVGAYYPDQTLPGGASFTCQILFMDSAPSVGILVSFNPLSNCNISCPTMDLHRSATTPTNRAPCYDDSGQLLEYATRGYFWANSQYADETSPCYGGGPWQSVEITTGNWETGSWVCVQP